MPHQPTRLAHHHTSSPQPSARGAPTAGPHHTFSLKLPPTTTAGPHHNTFSLKLPPITTAGPHQPAPPPPPRPPPAPPPPHTHAHQEDAIHNALLTMREGFEGEMNENNIEVAIIGEDRKFRVLTPTEVRDYLDEAN